jgi:hypothetical protein
MVFLLPHRGHRHEVPPFADENSNLVISGELLTVKGSLDQLPNPRTLCRLPATLSTCQHATQRKQAIKRYTNGIRGLLARQLITCNTKHCGQSRHWKEFSRSRVAEDLGILTGYFQLFSPTHEIFSNETTLSALLMEPLPCCTC